MGKGYIRPSVPFAFVGRGNKRGNSHEIETVIVSYSRCGNIPIVQMHINIGKWCPRCAFRLILFSDAQAEIVGNPKTKCKNCKRAEKTKQSTMKMSQIRRIIELCFREIIHLFEMNLLFLNSRIHIYVLL
jgi:hypothetical protein